MLDFQENEILTLTAEDGTDLELEFMGSVNYEGATYGAFFPVLGEDQDILDADYDMIILEIAEVDGTTAFQSVENEELSEILGRIFMEMIFGED